jgi:hypothetical protein
MQTQCGQQQRQKQRYRQLEEGQISCCIIFLMIILMMAEHAEAEEKVPYFGKPGTVNERTFIAVKVQPNQSPLDHRSVHRLTRVVVVVIVVVRVVVVRVVVVRVVVVRVVVVRVVVVRVVVVRVVALVTSPTVCNAVWLVRLSADSRPVATSWLASSSCTQLSNKPRSTTLISGMAHPLLFGLLLLLCGFALTLLVGTLHSNKPFYNGLCEYFSSGPIVCMVWEGKNAIKGGRLLVCRISPRASIMSWSSSSLCNNLSNADR